jgi:hypothetical protein
VAERLLHCRVGVGHRPRLRLLQDTEAVDPALQDLARLLVAAYAVAPLLNIKPMVCVRVLQHE